MHIADEESKPKCQMMKQLFCEVYRLNYYYYHFNFHDGITSFGSFTII